MDKLGSNKELPLEEYPITLTFETSAEVVVTKVTSSVVDVIDEVSVIVVVVVVVEVVVVLELSHAKAVMDKKMSSPNNKNFLKILRSPSQPNRGNSSHLGNH